MARPYRLTGEALSGALTSLTAAGWSSDPDRDGVSKTFRFKDFNAAFGWMTRVALEAERLDHHPEWRNVWNRVEVTLTTHDVQGLTALDVALAQAMDRYSA